jgi:DNA-binding transcriptional LysR family regulator
VLLSEFGAQLRPGVARLAADADALADDIRSARGQPVGEVRLGLLPSAVRRFTGALWVAVREQAPGVRLHLVEGATAQLEELLREGRLDMAVVPREDASAVGKDECLLARVPLHLFGRAGDATVAAGDICAAALSGLPLVVPARPHALRARLDRLAAERRLSLRVVVEADSVNLQLEVAAAGGGYAIAAVAGPQDARLSSSRIVDPELERYIVLAESPLRPQTRASRAVKRLVCEIAQAIGE